MGAWSIIRRALHKRAPLQQRLDILHDRLGRMQATLDNIGPQICEPMDAMREQVEGIKAEVAFHNDTFDDLAQLVASLNAHADDVARLARRLDLMGARLDELEGKAVPWIAEQVSR